jgi:hypothetical protein
VSSVQAIDRDQVEQMVTPCGDVIDPAQVAKTAGLRYVSDTMHRTLPPKIFVPDRGAFSRPMSYKN